MNLTSVHFDRRFYLNLSFWARCIKDCGPGAQARFRESMGLFFEAVNIQAKARDSGEIPTLESYIDVRRDTSGTCLSDHLLGFTDG